VTYVITGTCIVDTACVDVCPVDCIHPAPHEPGFATAEQLYIDATVCVQCNACAEACPVNAVVVDSAMPRSLLQFIDINAAYSQTRR